MTLRERLVQRLGGITQAALNNREKRAFEAGMEAGIIPQLGGDDEPPTYSSDGLPIAHGYRDTKATKRDLSSMSQEKAIEAMYRLWQTHPLAKAIIEIWVDYILHDGVTVTADNEEVQLVLDNFWNDEVNNLGDPDGGVGEGQDQLTRELMMFGELLVLTFVRTGEDKKMVADGLVRYGTIDPSRIYSVITDPRNIRDVLAVRLKAVQGSGGDKGPLYRMVKANPATKVLEGAQDLRAYADLVKGGRVSEAKIARTRKTVSGREWIVCEGANRTLQLKEATPDPLINGEMPAGECFYFRTNQVSTGVRGRPDMLPLIDWLDRYDQVFFDGAEHVALLNIFSWDLQIDGGSETTGDKELNLGLQAAKIAKLKPGSVYAHNEKAQLNAKNPSLQTSDLETIGRQLRIFIAGGARVPEHWLAEGGYTNRATAESMGQPTYRMLAKKQGMMKRVFSKLCRYQLDTAVALGQLPEEVDVLDANGKVTGKEPTREAFSVNMPDINFEDTFMAARAFALVTQGVLPLVASQFLPKKPALELIAAVADMLGVTLDVQAIMDEAEGVPAVDPAVLELLKRLPKANAQGTDVGAVGGNGASQ